MFTTVSHDTYSIRLITTLQILTMAKTIHPSWLTGKTT